ncbi:52 kDa repressor of the inhibitor of the protein kinase-like [Galendromus occidentalis]|uniref:52 kDa repressor of the inhibitor of the protein kinase-like n=1 Tax=Galendromus occidentalis TaxID=34638 RepID=A0AAJ7L598_9ACAR|nr:52 kDa repressor of the inhibitor of the protein kinase-like [Galendromus occidentalis]
MKRQSTPSTFFSHKSRKISYSRSQESVASSSVEEEAPPAPQDSSASTSALDSTEGVVHESPPPPVSEISPFSPLDIGHFVRSDVSLDDEQRYDALVNAWVPGEHYKFPKVQEQGRSRAFQHYYLRTWSWLTYSEMHGGGGFCKHCILFAKSESSDRRGHRVLGTLVTQPLNKFKKAVETLKNHAGLQYHLDAGEKARQFLQCYKDKPSLDVRNRLVTGREQQVMKNRQRLIPMIKTVLLCGRQNIALRGHRDNGLLSDDSLGDSKEGNFRALLRYRLDAGDSLLEEHLANPKRNATYISGKFQNEIIRATGRLIRKKIVNEVRDAKFFSILADETRDLGKLDQLTMCLRYVAHRDDQRVLKEVFLKFCDVTDKTGAGLARAILDNLKEEGLDVRDIRGQGYDGCSAMSGRRKGVQAEIRAVVPQALYFHCASHCLNLAVVHSTDVVPIRRAFGVVSSVAAFFSNSSSRVRSLEDQVEIHAPSSSKRRLKALCATRWVESHQAFVTFKELLFPIVRCLEGISQIPGDSGTGAYTLLNTVCNFDFLISLYTIESFASLLLPLSVNLQKKELDIFGALRIVDTVLSVLKERRGEAGSVFSGVFGEATKFSDSIDIEIKMPRVCHRQAHRENHTVNSPEDYFRTSTYIPYIDALITEFTSLFDDTRNNAAKLQFLIPKFTIDSSYGDMGEIFNFYEADLNCSESVLRGEFELWRARWIEVPRDTLPVNAIDALNSCCDEEFPKISILLRIFATLPVTTSSAERTFSSLRLLKTYLRSTMSEERLNGLTSMLIQKDVAVTPEEVLEVLALDPRKLDLVL